MPTENEVRICALPTLPYPCVTTVDTTCARQRNVRPLWPPRVQTKPSYPNPSLGNPHTWVGMGMGGGGGWQSLHQQLPHLHGGTLVCKQLGAESLRLFAFISYIVKHSAQWMVSPLPSAQDLHARLAAHLEANPNVVWNGVPFTEWVTRESQAGCPYKCPLVHSFHWNARVWGSIGT